MNNMIAATRIALAGGVAAVLLTACVNEPDPVELNITASATTVSVGQPVTFSITQDAEALAIYTGDEGHDYYKSAHYLLAGLTEAELKEQNYRPVDPEVKKVDIDLAISEPGATTAAEGRIEVLNPNTAQSMLQPELKPTQEGGQIVADEAAGGQPVLMLQALHPQWWSMAFRIHTDSRLGSNKTLRLRMRFDHPYVSNVNNGEESTGLTTFPVVVRLAGKAVGEDEVIFNDNTVWDILWTPTADYQDFTVDLGRIIPQWEQGTGKAMEHLSYIQVMFTATGTIGYVGGIYLQEASYGDIDYQPFDTGVAINPSEGAGVIDYQHIYTSPGTYKVVVLGTSTSTKNYPNGGYRDSMDGKIGAEEFRYDRQLRETTITVTP